jgi:hypothetical protein
MKRVAFMVGTLLLAGGLVAPALSATQAGTRSWSRGSSGPVQLKKASSSEVPRGPGGSDSAAAKLYRQQGYLVPDQARYERAKAAAAVRAGQGAQSTATASRARTPKAGTLIASGDPDINPAWTGQTDPSLTPPDTTGAIGPSRYIQLVNDRFGIYDRSGNVISQGGLRGLAGANTDCVTDPQVIWDPQTNRFYYVVLENSHYLGGCGGPPNPENRLYIGFSRTSSPSNGSSSWCKYIFPYDDLLPDYPKLGDNSAFMLIGSNIFHPAFGFLGADVAWITKPGGGTSCPGLAGNSLPGPLLDHNGNQVFTPVPANQTDTSGTGYVVAAADPYFYGIPNFVDTFPVSTNFGSPVGAPVAHSVAAFAMPANAPQSGTGDVLDTLDGRLTNAVSALDPSLSTTAIWTQHTVAGGAGSEVRWYELGAGPFPPLRSGDVSDGSLYTFNAAISPDRKVSGSTKRFGDAFVVGFNTSSASDFVRIQMVSQWRDYAPSEFVEVKASPGANEDFSCSPCRWGDYSGATPDPASNAWSNHGRIWLTNQWNVDSADINDVDWRTYVWGTNPVPFVVLNGPGTLFQKGKSFAVKWSLGNQASAADVQYRDAPWNGGFGLPILWQSQAPAGSATFTGAFGHTYCFSAQSYDDTVGGPRPWGFTAERCAVVPLDDRALSASSGWSRLNGSGFFNNTYTKSTTFGKSLSKSGIHAKRIQVMVEKCPKCGKIKIYWKGVLKHTYSLFASGVRKKVFLSAVSLGSVQTGTLKIVVSSPTGKVVIIDALAVSAV